MDQNLARLLSEKGLASYMNNTKWRKLCEAIKHLPFPPAYQVKTLIEDEPFPEVLETAPTYWGDWGTTPEAALGAHIEWVKVAPKFTRSLGHLVPPVVEDCTEDLRDLLHELRVPFVEEGGFFMIYGYAKNIIFHNE